MKSKLENLVSKLSDSDNDINDIQIYQNNELVNEYLWKPRVPRPIYSITKTITSLAVGIAVDEGLLSLSESLSAIFPEVSEKYNKSLRNITIHHLLSMNLGFQTSHLMMGARENLPFDDWADYIFNQKTTSEPGEAFLYSNAGHYLAGLAIENRSQESLLSYLYPRLFDPLNIEVRYWEKDPLGHTFGSGGLVMSSADLYKIGSLYMNNGTWKANNVVSKKFINQSLKPVIATESQHIYSTHYGYGLWLNREKGYYRADGAFGQLILNVPEKNVTIVISSKNADNYKIIDLIEKELLLSSPLRH